MFLLRFIEIVFIIALAVFVLTQFALPLLTNKPILWLFRKTPQADIERLKGKVATAGDENEVAAVAALKEKLKDRKAGGKAEKKDEFNLP